MGEDIALPRIPPWPLKARLMSPSPDMRNTIMLNMWIQPTCFSKERKISIAKRTSEMGSSRYPTPRSHESHEKNFSPNAPPPPSSARIKKPAIATKKIAHTPRNASLLTERIGEASASSRLFFPFLVLCFDFIPQSYHAYLREILTTADHFIVSDTGHCTVSTSYI